MTSVKELVEGGRPSVEADVAQVIPWTIVFGASLGCSPSCSSGAGVRLRRHIVRAPSSDRASVATRFAERSRSAIASQAPRSRRVRAQG